MKVWLKFVFASVLLLVGCALLVLGRVGYVCVGRVDAVVAAIYPGDDNHSVVQREKLQTEFPGTDPANLRPIDVWRVGVVEWCA